MAPKFNTRAYNQITKLANGIVRKTSTSERLLDEINYYKNISNVTQLCVLYPRLVNSTTELNAHNLYLEFYPYNTLSDYILSTEVKDWESVFSNLKQAISIMGEVKPSVSKNTSMYAQMMYIDKTFTEYQNFTNLYKDKDLFFQKNLIINDKQYKNFSELWPEVELKISQLLLDYTPSVIHGDMCFSNILYHEHVGPRFIDMRGSFGEKGIYGDSMYDYAKLFHSINGGYEYIINDRFTVCKHENKNYEIKILETANKQHAYNSFTAVFKHLNLSLVKLIEGLIYVGMCARHYDSETRQLIMYLTGIMSLNESIQEL